MPDLKQSLRDFVATSNGGKYSDEKILLSKFPELQGYDIQLLRDFVATSNSGKYSNEDDIFAKFPEFNIGVTQSKKKVSSESQRQQVPKADTTESPSEDGSLDTQPIKEGSQVEYWKDPNWNKGAFNKTINYLGGLQSEGAKTVLTFADDIINSAKNSLRGEGFFDDDIPDTEKPITDAFKNKISTIQNIPSSITKPQSDGGPLDPTMALKTVAAIGSKIINSTLSQDQKNIIISSLNLTSANLKRSIRGIDKYQEAALPKDNIPTNVVKGIVGMAPDLLAAAIMKNPQMAEGRFARWGSEVSKDAKPLLKKYVPKATKFIEEAVKAPFTKIMATKGAAAEMARTEEGENIIDKGIEGGVEGAAEGIYMHILGTVAGKAMPVIATGVSKTGLNSAIATAIANPLSNAGVFTTARALRTGIEEQRLISGEEALMEAGTGVGFSLLHAGSLYKNHKELNHYYDNTLKTDPLGSFVRVVNETKDNLDLVYNRELSEIQIKELEEARDEIKKAIIIEPDLNNKKLLGDEALKIQNQLDANSVINNIVENKKSIVDEINSNENLDEKQKEFYTKKVAAIAEYFDNSEFSLKKKELNSRIEEAQKNLDDAALSFTNLKKPSDRIQAKIDLDKRRLELDTLNNELTNLITEQDAIQKQGTNESVLRTEQPELGLQEVGERNAKGETITTEKPEEIIEIPADEIEALKEELSMKQNEGTLSENVDEKVYRGNEEGTIKIEGQQYIFETNEFKNELGNIDQVGDTPLASLELSIFPQEGVKTEPIVEGEKPSVVSVDGKEYTFLRQRRPKKGESIVVLKDTETGLQKAFRGDKAERILKDMSLQKPEKENILPLTVEGKEGEVKTVKEIKREQRLANKEARQEFESKSLDEIAQMQKELDAEADKVEQELLETIAKESKKENRLIFKLGEKEFAVSQKADNEFSVSQKNKEGKFVGIKDEKSRTNAIDEFKKIKESKDTERLKQAEELSTEYKKEQEDKILNALDKAIEATRTIGKGKNQLFEGTLAVPLMIANNSLKIVKAAYKGGRSLSESISEGYKFLKDKGYGVSEFEFKKYVLNNISKPTEKIIVEPKAKEPETAPEQPVEEKIKSAPSPIRSEIYFGEGRVISMAKDIKKITMTEKAAIVKQIKDLSRGGKDAQKAIRNATQELTKEIIRLREGGEIKKPQEKAILNRLSKTNVLSETSVGRYIDYVSKVYADAEYTSELNKARSTKRKISELSKDKDKNPSLKELGKKFISIEPSMVDDIYAYNKTAAEIKNAIEGSNKRKFKNTVVIDEVNKYVEEVLESQNKKLNEEIKSESSLIVDEEIREDVENNKEIEIKKEKELRVKIKNQFDDYANQIKEAIRTGENPLTGEEVSYSKKDKETIQKFMDMDLSLLEVKDAIFASDALQNFLANKSTAKMDSVLFSYEGVKGIKKLTNEGIKSRELTKYNSTVLGRQLADKVTSLPVMFEKMFPGLSRSGKVMDTIGMTKLFNKRSEALYEGNNIVDNFVSKLYKKKANGEDYNTQYNITERSLAAHSIRSLIGTEEQIQQEFNDRKSLIEQSIEALSKGNDKEKQQAELYKRAYDKILKDSNNADEVLAKTDKNNIEGVDFWIEEFAKKYDQSADVSENIYNTKLDRDLNYTPMKYSKLSSDSKEVELDNDQSSFHSNNGSIIVKKTGSLNEIQRLNKLPKGKYVDLSFDKNMSNSMYDLLTDINTAGPIRQIKAAINSPEFDALVPYAEDRALLKGGKNKMGRIELYVKNIRNKNPYSTSEDMKTLNRIASIGVGQALAGVGQPFKQTIPVAISTFINTKGRLDLGATFRPEKLAFINNSGYSIANRGRQSQAEIESVNKLMEKAEGSVGSKFVKYIEKANELQLKYLLEKPDVYIAKASWITYYEESLRKQGVDTKGLDYKSHKLNEEAANYAQRQVDRQQNISDHELAGRLFTDKNSYAQIFTKMLMPFSSFRMNAAAKFGADMITLRDKTSSKEDKSIARRSIAGYAAEMATFRAVSIGASLLIASLVKKYLGKEESEEEYKKRKDNMVKGAITGTFTDIFSPIPVLDPFVQQGGAKLTEGIDELMGTNIAIYDVPKQEFLKEYGTLGISVDRLAKLWSLGNLAATGKYTDEFGKEKQISEDDMKALRPLVPLALATDIGLAPTEINTGINYAVKFVKKKDSEPGPSEESKYLDVMEKSLLQGYKNRTDMEKYNPNLYEKNFGENSNWGKLHKEELKKNKLKKEEETKAKDLEYNYTPKEKEGFGSEEFNKKESSSSFGSDEFGED